MASIKERLLAIIDAEPADAPVALHLQYIADHHKTASITSDESGTITGVNRSARELFGYTFEELRGQPITILMPQEVVPRHLVAFKKRVEEELSAHVSNMIIKDKTLSGWAIRKDGSRFFAIIRLSSYRYNGSMSFMVSVEPQDDPATTST